MTEQKLVHVHVEAANPTESLERIRSAAGDETWHIVNIVPLGVAVDAKRVSPGINDPLLLGGQAVLVLLERDGQRARREVSDDIHPALN